MSSSLLHEHTKWDIEQFIAQPSHAVLLVGPEGAGKYYTANIIVAKLLQLPDDKLFQSAAILRIEPTETSIGIEQVRELSGFLRLKTPGHNDIRRVVIIRDVHTMTLQAQNALLKPLEEPPVDTIFILTTGRLEDVQATIISRAQKIVIKPIRLVQAQDFFNSRGTAANELNKNYALSNGNVGLLYALLNGNESHPLRTAIISAKQFLAASQFERLCSKQFNQEKVELKLFLTALDRVCHAASVQAAKSNASTLSAWHRRLQAVHIAESSLSSSVNTKLVLTHLALTL